MEDQILKILEKPTQATGWNEFGHMTYSGNPEKTKEITSMVFEFMEWAVRKEMLQYNGGAEERQTTYCGNYLNLEELFQYWWDNVKNK